MEPLEDRWLLSVGGLGAVGDSLTDEYLDPDQGLGYALTWFQALGASGVNVGDLRVDPENWGDVREEGYEFNWAQAGATSGSLLSEGQHTGLAGQVTAGDVTHAVLAIGQNDYWPLGAAYQGIYAGIWTQPQIDAHNGGILANMETALDTLTATGVKLVMSNVIDYGVAPLVRGLATDPVGRQRVADAIGQLNEGVAELAAAFAIPLVDMFALTKDYLGEHGSEVASVAVGGVEITNTGGTDGHNAFTADGIHPHTVLQAISANCYAEALNLGCGAGLDQFSEQEMLTLAGIGGEYVEDTLAINYSDYVVLPRDFGDAPDAAAGTGAGNYNTRAADNGPSHVIVPGLRIGANIDGETDAFPSTYADGDDNDGTPDDEDGVGYYSSMSLAQGSAPALQVTVTNTTGGAATLYGWIDYNDDGVFDNATEQASVAVPHGTNGGVVTLNFPAAPTGPTILTYARFRLSRDAAAADPTGEAGDGEVEDYRVYIYPADFGDAPDPYDAVPGEYPTMLPGGAWSVVDSGFCLGELIDQEGDGQPTSLADGDDSNGLDDDDGVLLASAIVPGGQVTLNVNVTYSIAQPGGHLNAWIDLDQNGDWLGAGEHFLSEPVVDGANQFQISVPASASVGPTYVRFRVGGQFTEPGGFSGGIGEVEDYLAIVVSEDLGPIGFAERTGLDLSAGGIWYQIETTQAGNLTFLATYATGAGTAELTVYDADGAEVGSSATGAGAERVDLQAGGAGEVYYVQLAGTNPDVDFAASQLYDFGDAPDLGVPLSFYFYNTRAADNGPSHVIVPGLKMGANIDGESDGFPSLDADGDDTHGTPDDEDGLVDPDGDLMFVKGIAPAVEVTVTNTTGSAATLYGWIDYNGNSVFDNATERASVVVPSGTDAQVVTLNFPVVPISWTGTTFARFRLSTDAAAADPTGEAGDGEVEDYAAHIYAADFGDAPDPFDAVAGEYPTMLPGGAVHAVQGYLHLGELVDNETDGQPTVLADGDDDNGLGDEDGVLLQSAIVPGGQVSLDVYVTDDLALGGRVNAWIDLNQDGDWSDADEHFLVGEAVADGLNQFQVSVPADASVGPTYVRFRLSTESDLEPGGFGGLGEVEDYLAIVVSEDLGEIGYAERTGLDLSAGDLWYQVETTRAGYLTFQATCDAGAGTAEMTVYDADGAQVDTSATGTGTERVDLDAPGAGEVYYVQLAGTNTDVDLKAVNMLSLDGTAAYVWGTDGPDSCTFDTAASRLITVNGVEYYFDDSEVACLLFTGGAGSDTAVFNGSADDEWLWLFPGTRSCVLTPGKHTFGTTGVETVTAEGGGGNDVVQMYGSSGSDTFTGRPDQAQMSGPGFTLSANHFRWMHGYRVLGGDDAVQYYDVTANPGTAQAVWFLGTPGDSQLYSEGRGFCVRAWGFGQVSAQALGDDDVAVLGDSAGSDTFEGYSDRATMTYATGDFVQADNFRWMHGRSTQGGGDTANLDDESAQTPGTHSAAWFIARPGDSRMYSDGYGFFARVKGFPSVTAHAAGNDDVAVLHDSAGVDNFEGYADRGTMTYADGTFVQAQDFRYLHGFSRQGSSDNARVYDETVAGASYATSFVGYVNSPVFYTGHNEGLVRVWDFEELRVSTDGVGDVATVYDTPVFPDWLDVPYEGSTSYDPAEALFMTAYCILFLDNFVSLRAVTSDNYLDDALIDPAYADKVFLEGHWNVL